MAGFRPVAAKSSQFTLAAASDGWEKQRWHKGSSHRGGIGVIEGKRCSGLLEIGDKKRRSQLE